MASKQSNVDFVLEQMADAGPVSARKMFGEYAIYCREKIVALFCDDTLFMKPTDAGRAFISEADLLEGAPFPGAKPWLHIRGDRCEDGEWLSELVRVTEKALPPPKPKPLKTQLKSPKNADGAAKAKRASASVAKSGKPAIPKKR